MDDQEWLEKQIQRIETYTQVDAYLTAGNVAAITARMNKLLVGKKFTTVKYNEYFYSNPVEMATDQQLKDGRLDGDTSVKFQIGANYPSDWEDAWKYVSIDWNDTYGSWGVSTLCQNGNEVFDKVRDDKKQGLVEFEFKHKSVKIEHYAPGGNRLIWILMVQEGQIDE